MSTLEPSQDDNRGASPEPPQPLQHHHQNIAEDLTLQVDFSWRRFKSLITNKDDPQASSPIYIVHHKVTKPHLTFKSAADNTAFATGSLHTFSIDAECEIRGRSTTLKALKRFKTEYMYRSHTFATNGGAEPACLTWTGSCGLKTWDYICLDEKQMPVAKFSANIWAVKKIGTITFLGSNIPGVRDTGAVSDAVREEIVVTALTLFYCMVLRTNSVLSLFGAVFSRPGHDERGEEGKEGGKSKVADSE
ncbi:hypothetical protein BDBG_03925 [Blastomyces gilchristii SLH14081]|uniref:Uncharacterized protein n=1 Tax=Blastomyces gilchristii (strain SLH14081) TaxID=559298 RepID=A0A179UJ58_BLAGS|nr:uncharacterized protein BDBG_03925 [Blastomyces gilchristii SLH14081]OAT07910.1 hypothetical protein BDBG_03925 [Blastomyces gilchristii SLH14081]